LCTICAINLVVDCNVLFKSTYFDILISRKDRIFESPKNSLVGVTIIFVIKSRKCDAEM
jgi:hypothetical protein